MFILKAGRAKNKYIIGIESATNSLKVMFSAT